MSHSHAHHQSGERLGRAFLIGIALNLAIVGGEAAAGWIGHSTALLADAGHNLTDVLSLALAGAAMWLARRPTSAKRTYGFRRATILASLANALFLVIISVLIAWEGVTRLLSPEKIDGPLVIMVAAIATVINAFTAWLFMRDQRGDLNVRAAFMHMATDAALSLGVVASGIIIFFTGLEWLDPAMSLVIVIAILVVTWGLLRESFDLSLDAVPTGIDTDAVQAFLGAQPGVSEVHHLHVWAMSTTEFALTAHLVKPDGELDDALLARVERELGERFGIGHVALQLECGDDANPCGAGPEQADRQSAKPKTPG